MSLKIDFSQEPKEAIEYIAKKGYKTTFHYTQMMHESHHKAFTVAKITKIDLLKDIHQSLISAQKKGQAFESWKKELIPTLQKKGWWGEVEVKDPKTKEKKLIYVGSRRLRTIFYTNIRVSYAVGKQRHQRALNESVYWRYVAILDSRTRPKHKQMHNIVKHRDDPWWNKNYPPNDWNCRCTVQALSKKSIEKRGYKIVDTPVENIASRDWAYNVGKDSKLPSLYKQKIDALPSALKKNFPKSDTIDAIFAISSFLKTAPKKKKFLKIGEAKDTPVYFSDYTRDKQLKHHPELLLAEYSFVPIMLLEPDEIFSKKRYRYYIKEFQGALYMAVFKVVSEDEIFLQSFRRTDIKDIERLKSKR